MSFFCTKNTCSQPEEMKVDSVLTKKSKILEKPPPPLPDKPPMGKLFLIIEFLRKISMTVLKISIKFF